MLLHGAGAAIAGPRGEHPTNQSVIALSLLFSTYVMAGGLIAAAYTDFLQGTMLVVLSVLLVPAGLNMIGGMPELQDRLAPGFMSVMAPEGASEGNPLFILAMSLLGLVGIVAQPQS